MRKNLKKNSNTKPLREKQVISEIIPKDNLSETAARRLLELKQALRVCQRSCSSDKEPAEDCAFSQRERHTSITSSRK